MTKTWKSPPPRRPKPECNHNPWTMAFSGLGARCGECGLVWSLGRWGYELAGEQREIELA